MPCYEVNTMSLEIEAADFGLLKKAAAKIGSVNDYGNVFTVYTQSGWFTVESNRVTFDEYLKSRVIPDINKMKREYSRAVIGQAAKAQGWTGKWKEKGETLKATFGKW